MSPFKRMIGEHANNGAYSQTRHNGALCEEEAGKRAYHWADDARVHYVSEAARYGHLHRFLF